VLQAHWDSELSEVERKAQQATVDLDADEATCPACESLMPGGSMRCPACGLRFG